MFICISLNISYRLPGICMVSTDRHTTLIYGTLIYYSGINLAHSTIYVCT